jgi:hypothetical protein
MGGDVLWPSRLASWMAYLNLGSSAMVVSDVWGSKLRLVELRWAGCGGSVVPCGGGILPVLGLKAVKGYLCQHAHLVSSTS